MCSFLVDVGTPSSTNYYRYIGQYEGPTAPLLSVSPSVRSTEFAVMHIPQELGLNSSLSIRFEGIGVEFGYYA